MSEEEIKETSLDAIKGNIVKSPMVGTFYLKPSASNDLTGL
jgi:biotin carboxyl carrier protein